MATQFPAQTPQIPAIARILSRYERGQIESFIAVAIDLLDFTDGDTDLEDNGLEDDFTPHPGDGAGCPIADSDCCSARDDDPPYFAGDRAPGDPDDREEDDEDRCPAGDDGVFAGSALPPPTAKIDINAGDPDDAEDWQQTCNVPVDPVFSLEHNIFNDKRPLLGRSNLLSSFRTNGGEETSADTGNVLRSTDAHGGDRRPGVPI